MSIRHHVSLISAAETLPLRQKVLKPFLQIEECGYPEDDFASTMHFGLFHGGKIISIATFIHQASPDFSAGFPYRLRGMATDETYRMQGFGSILLRHGLDILREKRCDFVWMNARARALGFYESLGFIPYGNFFEIKDIGAHKVMYKHIIPR